MIRILLADDHGIVRQGTRSLLEKEPEFAVAGEAEDGRTTVEMTEALHPDLVVMDIAMPQLNGLDAAAQITKRQPEVGIVILSMHEEEDYLVRALSIGVRGYLLKENAQLELVPAVRAVHQKKSFFSPAIARMLADDFTREMQKKGLADSYELLTEREREVLQLLAEGRSNKEVAAVLDLSPYTVETHRNNLMQKLNLHNMAEIVLYAVRKKIVSY
ncbi:MAG: response regulator transcription factor [Acidobacteria bacterium]|nr:response regulator transcription factor [Acidobacteriota bacterium]